MSKNIVLKDAYGNNQTFEDIDIIVLKDENGENVEFVSAPSSSGGDISGILTKTIMKIDDVDSNVVSIFPGAFSSCSFLSQVNFPVCLNIGQTAFSGCSSLAQTNFPVCTSLGSSAFCSCRSLTQASFPACIMADTLVFSGCTSLKEVLLPIISFNSSLFMGCSSLISVYLPVNSRDTRLNNSNAFSGTPIADSTYLGYYGSIYVPTEAVDSFKKATNWTVYADRITALPESYRSEFIYGGEYDTSNISDIPLSRQGIKYICTEAFTYCPNLSQANFPSCLTIGRSAFAGCSSLAQVNFPVCLNIGQTAFSGCSSLAQTNFPVCLSLGIDAFTKCTALDHVSFPVCVNIATRAFYSCAALNQISFPLAMSIGNSAFQGCASLSSVSFPSCLDIGVSAFYGCSSLSIAIFNGSVVPILGTNAFNNTPISLSSYLGKYGSIYVQSSLVDAFRAAENWSLYADRITSIENL